MMDLLISFVGEYGYFAVFLLAMVDHTGTPGGLLLSMGVATTGYFDFYTVFLVSFVGGLVGDVILYLLGLYGGRKVLRRFAKNKEGVLSRIDRASDLFKDHGKSVVFFGRFPPLIGKYVMILAGACAYPFFKFLIHSILGGLLMVVVYGVPYFFFGSELNELFESKVLALYLVLVFLILHLIISLLVGWWKGRRG